MRKAGYGNNSHLLAANKRYGKQMYTEFDS